MITSENLAKAIELTKTLEAKQTEFDTLSQDIAKLRSEISVLIPTEEPTQKKKDGRAIISDEKRAKMRKGQQLRWTRHNDMIAKLQKIANKKESIEITQKKVAA